MRRKGLRFEDYVVPDSRSRSDESLEEVWGEMDAESVPYRLPQK